jgi:glyoxylase-like metal-dependent hydrolase (beta-lactamase superfamily II)
MRTTISARHLAAALCFAIAGPAAAQYEAAGVLKRAADAMGVDAVKSLRYSGRGTGASYGQAYLPTDPWPRLNYSRYLREVDYEKVFTREDVMRSRAEPKGGGAVPLSGEAHFAGVANDTRAWNMAGQNAAYRQAAHTQRMHDLWITPHGVIKAAMKANATLTFRDVGGRQLAAVSFTQPGIMTATALVNEAFLVERVESRMPDPVLGDTAVVTTYAEYRDFGGIKFPTRIEQQAGGSPVLAVTIAEVQPNAAIDVTVPANVANAAERVVAEKAADGVWFIAGGSHNSVLVERSDHLLLIETPLGDERSGLVIAEAKKLVPGKPIRYVVNSHNHFDHSGGLRRAVAEGATLVVEAKAKPYFEKVLANPNRIAPDAMAKSGKKAKVMGVAGSMVMKDSLRTVELHHLRNTDHGDSMLMAWLPAERILVQADLFTPLPPNAPAPNPPNAYHVNLVDNLAQKNVRPERILPLHGRIVPIAELQRMVGK